MVNERKSTQKKREKETQEMRQTALNLKQISIIKRNVMD